MTSRLTTVWGNPGAGKSLVSLALAHRLTAMKQSVILISASKLTPMARVFLPFLEEKPEHSLAKLLTDGITPAAMRQKILLHPKNENLGIMTLVSADNALQYQGSWDRAAISELYYTLKDRELADHVIIDCASDLFGDNMTYWALETADHLLCVLSPDNRGVAFYLSQEPVLRSGSFQMKERFTVLNNAYDYSPAKQIAKDLEIQHILPHCPEVYGKYLTGDPILRLYGKAGHWFEEGIRKLAKEVSK